MDKRYKWYHTECLVKDQPYFNLLSFIGEFSFYRKLENIYFKYNNQVNNLKSLEVQIMDMKKHIKSLYPNGELFFILPPFMGKLLENEKFKNLLIKTKILKQSLMKKSF